MGGVGPRRKVRGLTTSNRVLGYIRPHTSNRVLGYIRPHASNRVLGYIGDRYFEDLKNP